MHKLIGALPNSIKFKEKLVVIDNLIFRLYYRYTVSVLGIAMILISTTELTGEHIKCVLNEDSGVGEAFMNRYCYLMTTFTVTKYLNSTLLDNGDVPHAGVGPIGSGVMKDADIQRHAYYQWVFFVFLLQSLLFYVPHMMWKHQEGGRIGALTAGLHNAVYATTENTDREVGGQTYPTKDSVQKQFDIITTYLKNHLRLNRFWGLGLISFEVLNLIILTFNIWLTNVFLGYQFMSLGPKVVNEGFNSSVDVLDVVFPKMTKCTFRKYGPSGTVQPIDAICVMAQNIFNEKTFVFLWFWYLALFTVTASCLVWRLVSMCLYRTNRPFNKFVFLNENSRLDIGHLLAVTQTYSYLDWVFLVYLATNMSDLVFQDFFKSLANAQNILIDISSHSTDDDSGFLNEKLLSEIYVEREKTK